MTVESRYIDGNDCYWTVIDKPSEQTAAAIAFAFERDLPLPAEAMHVAVQPLSDQRLLLCGLPHEVMQELHDNGTITPDVWSLGPRSIPERIAHLFDDTINPDDINLLCDRWLAPAQRRWRRRLTIVGSSMLALLIVSAIAAISAQTDRYHQAAAHHEAATLTLLREAFPQTAPSATALHAKLTTSLRLLEQRTLQADQQITGAEAPMILQAMLAAWPNDMRVQVDSLTVTSARVVARGRVTTLDDAQRLQRLMRHLEVGGFSYVADTIQASQRSEAVDFTLTLRAQQSGAGR